MRFLFVVISWENPYLEKVFMSYNARAKWLSNMWYQNTVLSVNTTVSLTIKEFTHYQTLFSTATDARRNNVDHI